MLPDGKMRESLRVLPIDTSGGPLTVTSCAPQDGEHSLKFIDLLTYYLTRVRFSAEYYRRIRYYGRNK